MASGEEGGGTEMSKPCSICGASGDVLCVHLRTAQKLRDEAVAPPTQTSAEQPQGTGTYEVHVEGAAGAKAIIAMPQGEGLSAEREAQALAYADVLAKDGQLAACSAIKELHAELTRVRQQLTGLHSRNRAANEAEQQAWKRNAALARRVEELTQQLAEAKRERDEAREECDMDSSAWETRFTLMEQRAVARDAELTERINTVVDHYETEIAALESRLAAAQGLVKEIHDCGHTDLASRLAATLKGKG